ncbi:MAG TPA: sigma-70 family RNA polymerase sigma factor [Syntrophorhabdaceae bacterium]|nr:sigma-70 family RNA polymerase sigma factor [Syntrophorhabdaceae bacterium]HPL41795.1 sigma-70 family RNA polymerase sigma factor [Syntrophorhabdaceae bacterium]
MDSTSLSEKDLLNECINGNKKAWDSFVERYTNLIYHTINKILRLHNSDLLYDDIEDIHNSIFLSLMENNYKKLRQYRGIDNCSVSSWVMVITTNFTINHITRRKTYVSLDAEDPDKGQSALEALPDDSELPLERLNDKEQVNLLQELMSELIPNDRLFLKYYYEDELPPEEIASIMHLTVSAVYSKKSRIIDKLRNIAKERKILQEI